MRRRRCFFVRLYRAIVQPGSQGLSEKKRDPGNEVGFRGDFLLCLLSSVPGLAHGVCLFPEYPERVPLTRY